MRRVVITGMGVVSALGCSVESSFERLKRYENAVINYSDLHQYKGLHSMLGSPIQNFEIPEHYTRKVLRTMGPISVMALVAAEQALTQAELLNNPILQSGRCGVSYGSSFGSVEPVVDFFSMLETKAVNAITSSTYVKTMPQTAAVNLSLYFKTTGRLIPTGTACTSGSMGIGYAYEAIQSGVQDVMIAGGAEEFSPVDVGVFDALYATSTKNDIPKLTPSPFDVARDGLVIGEGAGVLILEEYEHAQKRGAPILAEIVGFATNTDGTHITQPNSVTMAKCMVLALESAKLKKQDIGYVNAHGTSTIHGDIAESTATEEVMGYIPISSLKSYVGHTLGACGALEAIWSIEMMNHNWFAPTLNLHTPDEKCGKLDYIMDEGRTIDTDFVMSNNFAFGGINTSLIFKRTH